MSRSEIARAAAVIAVLMGTLTGVSAAQENDTGPRNRALIDTEATKEALDAAKSLSEELFSFSHTDVKGHEATFARLTTGDFTRDYGKLFHTVVARAQTEKLTLTSTVVESGVQVLREDTAEVLVFLDQSSRSATTNQETASQAMFRATIQRVDGDWKFADIDLYEGS
jgi:Mce-associated membrane protein